ncbi:MAG: L,D-transpeptidase, partial [Atopobiaceae bacterium]|nr:L,D-transpeptidase [Atopobiaceae bacterium]
MVQFSNAGYAAGKGVQRFTSPTKYILVIDNSNYRTFVFTGSKGNWEPLYDWLATVGTSPENGGDETFGETYRGENGYVDRKGVMMGECPYEFYWTEFYLNNAAREANPENPEGQRFHSILYWDRNHTKVYDDTLGAAASHGCVRLALDNAKWVYDNIPKGTRVWSY